MKNGVVMFKEIQYTIFCLLYVSIGICQVDYSSDIQPIFTNNCGACHIDGTSGELN